MKKLVSLLLVAMLIVAFAAPTMASGRMTSLGQNAPYGRLTAAGVGGTLRAPITVFVYMLDTPAATLAGTSVSARVEYYVGQNSTLTLAAATAELTQWRAAWSSSLGSVALVSPTGRRAGLGFNLGEAITMPSVNVDFLVGNGVSLRGTSVMIRLRVTAAGNSGYSRTQPSAAGQSAKIGETFRWNFNDVRDQASYNFFAQIKLPNAKSFRTAATDTFSTRRWQSNFAGWTGAAIIAAIRGEISAPASAFFFIG